MQFTALEAGANLSLLMYNFRDLSERYNMPDTLKAQHTSHLTTGNVLMSDNGRVMTSIIQDSLGWHDTISGYIHRYQVDDKFGITHYQDLRNDWYRSGDENFAMELVRNGLGVRDLVPPVNLFTKVWCDDEGNMHFVPEHCPAGSTVTLRTEMDIVIILSNTPNPLETRSTYSAVPIRLDVSEADPVVSDDVCVTYCPENLRAFENTWSYYTLI